MNLPAAYFFSVDLMAIMPFNCSPAAANDQLS